MSRTLKVRVLSNWYFQTTAVEMPEVKPGIENGRKCDFEDYRKHQKNQQDFTDTLQLTSFERCSCLSKCRGGDKPDENRDCSTNGFHARASLPIVQKALWSTTPPDASITPAAIETTRNGRRAFCRTWVRVPENRLDNYIVRFPAMQPGRVCSWCLARLRTACESHIHGMARPSGGRE